LGVKTEIFPMFVRKLNHPNGKVYVQIVEKQSGKYIVHRSFGAAVNDGELDLLVNKA